MYVSYPSLSCGMLCTDTIPSSFTLTSLPPKDPVATLTVAPSGVSATSVVVAGLLRQALERLRWSWPSEMSLLRWPWREVEGEAEELSAEASVISIVS